MKKRIIALMLAVITVFGMLSIPTSAATISDGSKTCSVQNGPYHRYLSTTAGNTVGGGYRHYKTNDGITGPAYCIDWGLAMAPANKQLAISRYTSSPKTIGAFANGYPQRTLEEFLKLHLSDNPALKGLTEDEYAYATQVAVWATLGQLGVEGTSFTAGRATIAKPTNDAQKVRIYTALSIVLRLANGWDKQLYSGMYLRSEENALGATLEIQDGRSLEDAANSRLQGIQKETINGKEYYTRKFWAASATSTWPFDDKIGVWFSGAPTGTLVTDASNNVLPVKQLDKGGTVSLIPTEKKSTSLNVNGEEYSGVFKLCLPVDNVTEGGEIGINLYGTVSQYVIYLADNPSTKEQSYIIADPAYNNLTASGKFIWGPDEGRDTARISVMKVDGGNKPLAGAEFSLEGSDGSVYTGKTGPDGLIEWDGLDPDGSPFTLRETKAPEGYGIVDPINIKVTEGNTSYVTVRDDTDHSFRVKKIDAQNGYSLRGAVFRFEQIDGSFVTTGTTGHDGIIEFTGKELPFGSYRVSEEQAPAGYKKDTSVQTVEWDGTADVLLTFRDVREPTLIIYKVDSRGNSISGATFAVYQDGSLITTVECDDAGIARVSGLSEGYFEVEELTAPAGFVLDSTLHGIHLDPYDPAIDDDPSITIVNKAKCGLRIVKYDRVDHEPMQGVTFEVFCDAVSLGRFETSAEGEILLSDLRPGTYRAVEIDTGDDGHIRDVTAQEIELHADDDTRELIFFNDRLPGLHLIKVDSADLSTPISNAKFRFEAVDGSWGPEEMTSGPDGTIDLSKLPAGAVVVTELECPGYIVDEAQRIIYLHPNDTAQFVFTNSKRPTLRLIKTSADGTPLEGVTFRIAHVEDGTHYINRTTNSAGEIVVSDLEPGVFSVVETATLPNHILNPKEHHVELFPGKTSEIRLENDKRPNLIIYKHDADTGEPIPNTVFLVKAADGHSVNEAKTGPDGKAVLENLLPGVYEISEKSVPAPWLNDAAPQLVTLYPNKDREVSFENHRKPTLTVNKVDSITGDPIEGAKFQVWYGSNNTTTGELNDLGTFHSDGRGQFVIDLLRDGWYKISELEPAHGYAIKEPATQEVYIKGGESKVLTFENVPLSALIVWKYDSKTGEAVEGAIFQVRYLGGMSGTGGTVIGTYKTGPNGSFSVTGLKEGNYIVEELASDSGHVIDTAPQTAYISGKEQDVIQLYFGNSPKGALLVKKIDSVTHEPLAGVEFLVTTSDGAVVGNANGKYTTDSAGTFLIDSLDPGLTLIVKESRAKENYILDDVPQTVKIKSGETVSLEFRNQPTSALLIVKKDAVTGKPLAGVEFLVTDSSGGVIGSSNGKYTTDSAGTVRVDGLTPGMTVITKEIRAKEGYLLDDTPQTVKIKANETVTLEFLNQPAGSLVIVKRDTLTGKPLEGVTFKVTTSTGEFVPDENGRLSSNGLYWTDKDGKITINGVVGSLVVTETKSIPGYSIDPGTQTQTVVVYPNDTQTLNFYNTPSTTLVIEKYIEGTTEPLKGVTFLVTDSSGAVVGQSNGEYITDEAGRIVITDLTPGITVTAREIKTVEGVILDGTPKSILIKEGEVQTLRFYNQRKGTLVVKKLDELTGKPLAGVEFQITYAEGGFVDDANGHLSSKGIYWTDSNGEIRISGVVGSLVVTETKCLPGYTIDPVARSQTVTINPADTQTLYFYNTKIGGLTIIKKDEETGERIKGVQFEVRRLNGEIIGTYTTDRNGVISLPQAEKGWYEIVERKQAEGYRLDDTPHRIEVKDGQTATLEITNRQAGSALIHKVDSLTGEGIYGVTFLISDAKGNPIGTYQSDSEGYVFIDKELADGKYTARELECAPGYILDTQPKTFYVKYGGCTTITWPNTAVRGQIQIIKKSADYNPTNGLPAGTLLEGATFEIYNERNGNKVDTIVTGANGLASSKRLPLGRYTIRETKAPANYGASSETYTAVLEYSGQIVKLEITNKSLSTGVSIEKTGPKEATSGQPVRYVFSRIGNTSNVMLQSFYWRDTLPAAVRLDKVVTGTYNFPGTYKIVYKVNNTGDYRTLADSLSTSRNYSLAASPTALGLGANERVTEIMFVFGQVPGGFSQVEAPMLHCKAVSGLTPGSSFVNTADVGGTYNGVWVQAVTRWVTTVYGKPTPLPRTGY